MVVIRRNTVLCEPGGVGSLLIRSLFVGNAGLPLTGVLYGLWAYYTSENLTKTPKFR